MAATMGRGFLQLESEWSLSGTGTMVFQDTVNILGCGLQGKKGRKPKRMAGQAVWLCYVHLASAMPLPLSDGCQHSECLISYSAGKHREGTVSGPGQGVQGCCCTLYLPAANALSQAGHCCALLCSTRPLCSCFG